MPGSSGVAPNRTRVRTRFGCSIAVHSAPDAPGRVTYQVGRLELERVEEIGHHADCCLPVVGLLIPDGGAAPVSGPINRDQSPSR